MVLARTRQAACKPRGTGTQVKAVNPGKAKLNAAADKAVGMHRAKIVKTLYDSWINDKNLTSVKLLFDLADGLIDCENQVVMSQLCSYAEKLEAEPQLTGDEAESDAEQDEGKRAEVAS